MGSRAKVSILCVNRLLRESIARILTKRTDFEILIAQMDTSTLCEQTLDSGADVLVLDSLDVLLGNFDLSRCEGLRPAKRLRSRCGIGCPHGCRRTCRMSSPLHGNFVRLRGDTDRGAAE